MCACVLQKMGLFFKMCSSKDVASPLQLGFTGHLMCQWELCFQPSSGETPLGLVGPGLPWTGDTLQMQEERGARKPGGWLVYSSELAINSAQMVTSFWESASGAKSLA